MTTGNRRPRRSNAALDIVRGIRTQKAIYWTIAKLQALLRRIVKTDREEWFAARIRALKAAPELTREQIHEASSRVNPRRLMDGKWSWPISQLGRERKLTPPEDGIDLDALRAFLESVDERTGEKIIEMLTDSELLKDTTVPLDNGLPQPKEVGLQALRRIRKADAALRKDLAGDPDGDLATARQPEVPRANLQSPAGRLDDASRLYKLHGRWRGR